ncbi:MAG: chloride channel protein, partial [Alphaproteobacteria bacterium]
MRTQSAAGAGLLLRRFLRNEHFNLSILAAVIGAAAGLGALAFRAVIGQVQSAGFGFSSELVITGVRGLPWWQILAVPTAGGLIVGLLLHYLVPGGRAHGVPNVIEAVSLHGGRMSLRHGLVSAAAAAASIGVGASTGREGPVVHLGATLAAWLSEKLKLGPGFARTLLGCGAAAAVAASFNAPIAGVLFALEVIIGHHALKAFAPIVIASVTGTVIGRIRFGNAPAFVVPENVLLSLWEFPAFVLLGIACAIAAIVFMRSILWAEKLADASPIPPWARPACAGLFVGGIALVLPHVMGVGYEATDAALRAEFTLSLLLVLIVAKIAATAISLGFGFAGGVFSPSLYIGALIGGAFGIIAGTIFPDLYSGTPAYALIGTGAVAGAVLGAPMSTILIIFELTGDYTTTIAVMIATVVASVITHQFFGRSFFHVQLKQRGLDLAEAEQRDL